MAQFRAIIKGARGETSRLGSKASGISAKINGWLAGVSVSGRFENDRDTFEICASGGSHARSSAEPIARVAESDTGPIVEILINGEWIERTQLERAVSLLGAGDRARA